MSNKQLLFDNGDGTFTKKYTHIYSVSDTSFKGILFRVLKICLSVAVLVLVFRLFINRDSLTFSQILNYIAECPNYYQDVLGNFLQRSAFEPTDNSFANLLGLGELIRFLDNVIDIIVYVFGSIYSCALYFVYILGILFI